MQSEVWHVAAGLFAQDLACLNSRLAQLITCLEVNGLPLFHSNYCQYSLTCTEGPTLLYHSGLLLTPIGFSLVLAVCGRVPEACLFCMDNQLSMHLFCLQQEIGLCFYGLVFRLDPCKLSIHYYLSFKYLMVLLYEKTKMYII